MIYTVTLSPSLDYTLKVANFTVGKTNRATQAVLSVGGKGVNVAIALKRFGQTSTALGFTAGFTGDEIIRMLNQAGVESDFIQVNGLSRINVKMLSCAVGQQNEETEINGVGPSVTNDSVVLLKKKLTQVKRGDALILAGSVPQGIPKNIYADMLSSIAGRNVLTVVDTSSEPLLQALTQHPFLIKPNKTELSELLNKRIETVLDACVAAREAQKLGARNVLVSLGALGAALAAEDGNVYTVGAIKGKRVNTVGAGDCMVAGFTTDFLKKADFASALKYAAAAGSACAFSEGLAERVETEKLLNVLEVSKVEGF